MSQSQIIIDESSGGDLLVGVDGEMCSGTLALSSDAVEQDVEEVVETLLLEATHTVSIRGGRDD